MLRRKIVVIHQRIFTEVQGSRDLGIQELGESINTLFPQFLNFPVIFCGNLLDLLPKFMYPSNTNGATKTFVYKMTILSIALIVKETL
ncbi:MAG: hypothetical protein SCARUB_03926 [Candidatus Scalindua rubra]|uniref:Uncharacterized protein n=1 Tax=Candidatus Scalindua rubra TaxID=1872076 RepID=A0A1E3X7M1_9BACT|nr:MAG: hypothetical protein SCARUB_03926 [Candidatus Scalindua rubra]